mmetsp:Transcript_23029/g.26489  ORF Transcript_23029/g.26489 Transcript_23029/m.26489 type:complete len:85 (+) Transcript_23029:71-325(+)
MVWLLFCLFWVRAFVGKMILHVYVYDQTSPNSKHQSDGKALASAANPSPTRQDSEEPYRRGNVCNGYYTWIDIMGVGCFKGVFF